MEFPSRPKRRVTTSLVKLMRKHPAVGWVRGNLVPDVSAAQTINRLRDENDDLRKRVEKLNASGPPDSASLAQGEDSFVLEYTYDLYLEEAQNFLRDETGSCSASWDEIFIAVAAHSVVGADEKTIKGDLNQLCTSRMNNRDEVA